jgi:hypothetical protein
VRLRTRKGNDFQVRSPLERPDVFAGALRDPTESGSLSVTISVWPDQIVLHNDNVELGEWPRHRVRIIPLDSTTFEFVAEGDRMLFIPDDRIAFAAVATEVVRAPEPSKQKRRGKGRKATAEADGATTPDAAAPAGTSKRRASAKASKSAKAAKKAAKKAARKPTQKPNRTHGATKPRRTKRDAARSSTPGDAPTSGAEAGSPPATGAAAVAPAAAASTAGKRRMRIRTWKRSATDTDAASASDEDRSGVRPPGQISENADPSPAKRSRLRPRRSQKAPAEAPTPGTAQPARAPAYAGGESGPTKMKTKRWIGVIDLVRTHSISGLDRVPVDVSLRGSQHQHTWDHRAAASSGPSKHICTICGKLRF